MSIEVLYCPACGAANEAAETHCEVCLRALDEAAEARVLAGHYRLGEQLGVGGFGAVYRAKDMQQPELPLAIKEINLDGLSARQIIEATETFERERRLLTFLDHPRLPHLHETFEDAHHWYLVIDYFPGETLELRLAARQAERRRRLSTRIPERALVEDLLRCGLSLCEVLDYLHTRTPPVVFRDLKPGNIICLPDGTYALIDFGIARTVKPGQAKDTVPLGSPGYAAPEQYGKAQTDARADIYSLGAILHQILTGEDPSEQPLHFAAPHYTDPLLKQLEKLILSMVALNAEMRPASIALVARELRAIQDAYEMPGGRIWVPPPGQTPPWDIDGAGQGQQHIFQPPALPTPQVNKKRRDIVIAGVVVGGILLSGALGISSTILRNPGPTINTGPAPAGGVSFSADLPGESLKQLAWSPADRLLVVVSRSQTYAGDILRVWDARGDNEVIMSQTLSRSVGYQSLAWSTNGKHLLALYTGDYIHLWQQQGDITLIEQQPLALPERPASGEAGANAFTQALLWSPDGSKLAYSLGLTIYIYDLRTARVVSVYRGHEQDSTYSADTFSMAWSPDGQYIASTNGTYLDATNASSPENIYAASVDQKLKHNPNPLRIWRVVDGGTVETLPPLNGGFSWLQWSPNSHYLSYGNPGQIFLYDPVSRQMKLNTPLGPWHSATPRMPLTAWSPNALWFAYPTANPALNIQIMDVATGTIEYNCTASKDLTALTALAWSPNGQVLAAAYKIADTDGGGYSIVCYNASDGKTRTAFNFTGNSDQVEALSWSPDSSLLASATLGNNTLTIQAYSMA